jgi:hypothetical protein
MGANKGDEVFINEIKAGNQAAFEAMVLKCLQKKFNKKKLFIC